LLTLEEKLERDEARQRQDVDDARRVGLVLVEEFGERLDERTADARHLLVERLLVLQGKQRQRAGPERIERDDEKGDAPSSWSWWPS